MIAAMLTRDRPLKILIHGINFLPELTGIGKYTGEMAVWLARRGHQVRVVTAPPYYPSWQLGEGYRNRYAWQRPEANLTVVRCPVYIPAQPSGVRRMLHLASFAASSLPVVLGHAAWAPDAVLSIEPALFAAPVSLLGAFASGATSWLHIQDFEIDAAFDLGLLPSGGFLHDLALGFEQVVTRAFDRVSSISVRMTERAVGKGVPPGRVCLFPNWVDVHAIPAEPPSDTNSFRQKLGLAGKTVLLYSGNMGNKQGIEILPALAAALAKEENIHLLLCGEGAFRPEIERLTAGMRNITLLPLQPVARLSSLLNAADIHLLPQKSGMADLVMPSKLTGMLSSGRPVIATAEQGTQVAEVIGGRLDLEAAAEPCGLVVPSGDLDALTRAVRHLAADPFLRCRMGAAARRYAVEHLGQEEVLLRFEAELTRAAHGQ